MFLCYGKCDCRRSVRSFLILKLHAIMKMRQKLSISSLYFYCLFQYAAFISISFIWRRIHKSLWWDPIIEKETNNIMHLEDVIRIETMLNIIMFLTIGIVSFYWQCNLSFNTFVQCNFFFLDFLVTWLFLSMVHLKYGNE